MFALVEKVMSLTLAQAPALAGEAAPPTSGQDLMTVALMVLAAGLAATAVAFAGFGVSTSIAQQLSDENDESGGAASGGALIKRLGAFNQRLMSESYALRVRKNLIKAGEPSQYQPEDILAMQEIGAIVGIFFGLFAMNALEWTLAGALLVGAGGFIYPLIWLNDQVKRRHFQITRALPYNLDLLTLSVEAGLDFTGALQRVVDKGKKGALRDEFNIVLKQLKMGKTREEGLKSLIERVDLPALNQFVVALVQADRMGTSLGKILRVQSTQLRIERTQRAEKLANEAPVKMLGPLIGCIFPTMFLILFGPIVFAIVFGNALS